MTNLLRRSLLLIASSALLLWLAGRPRISGGASVSGVAGARSAGSALLVILAIGVLILGTWLAVLALRECFRNEEPMALSLLATFVVESVALATVQHYFAAAASPTAGAVVAQGTRQMPSKSAGIVGLLLTLAVMIGAAVAITRMRRLVQ
jgi:hypothetical protein